MSGLTIEATILKRIKHRKANVFVRSDFEDVAGYDQVGRALRLLVKKGTLLKFGQGVYVRSQISPFDGQVVPTVGIKRLAEEALKRLKIPVAPSRLEQDYNAGRTTQVPTGRVVGVRKRVRRQLGYGDVKIAIERAR